MATLFKNFTNMKALLTVPMHLFQRLLSAYRSYCSERELNIDELEDTEASREALCRFFVTPDPEMPPKLLNTLNLVDDLATEAGFNLLIDTALKTGIDILKGNSKATPRMLAIIAFLDFPRVFEGASDRQFIETVETYTEYASREERRLSSILDEILNDIAKALGEYHGTRGRGTFCRVRAYVDRHEANFMITHGRPFKIDGSVDDRTNNEESVSYRPNQHDVVKYDNQKFRLKIKASDNATRKKYREVFGAVLFEDPSFFGDDSVMTLAPLVTNGRASLEPTPGLQYVTLTSVKLAKSNIRNTVHHIESADVFADLEENAALSLATGELLVGKFALCFNGSKRERKLEIRPPNQIVFKSNFQPGVVTEFLETRGFYIRQDADEGAAR